MPSKTRYVKGRAQVLCGGYVSYDTRKKDDYGYPIRTTREVQVWMPAAGGDYDDCGHYTSSLVRALKDKVGRKIAATRQIEVSECWRY